MTGEVALFWIVAAGFWIADSLLLVPAGCEAFRVDGKGRIAYRPAMRIEARRREIVWQNPFDLFGRIVVTTAVIGAIDPHRYAQTRRELRRWSSALRPLGWIGSAYLAAAVLLAAWSTSAPFAWVALPLLAIHVGAWAAASVLLVRRRAELPLANGRLASLVVEALFVPAYTIGLGTRALRRQRLDLPALPLALHRAKAIGDAGSRALYLHRLEQRITAYEEALPDTVAAAERRFIEGARRCLATSASAS